MASKTERNSWAKNVMISTKVAPVGARGYNSAVVARKMPAEHCCFLQDDTGSNKDSSAGVPNNTDLSLIELY